MNVETHIASGVENGGIRVCGSVVEEVDGCFGGCLGALGLGSSKATECNEHCVVNGAAIVKENADDFLESGDASFVKGRGIIRGGCEDNFAAIDGFGERRWGMLGTGRLGCFKTLESFGDVSGHGEFDGSVGVVPVESDAAIEFAGPVGGHLILGGDDASKILSIFSSDILYAKVVNN